MKKLVRCILLLSLTFEGYTQSGPWPDVTREMKPWTRWWWMGNAVDTSNLSYLLNEYSAVGFGGVEITPIYGVKGEENRNIEFLSDEWMDILRYTTAKANSLNLGVDMNCGTGWPFGGPQISIEDAATKLILQKYEVAAGEEFSKKIEVEDSLQKKAGVTLEVLVSYSERNQFTDLTTRIYPDGTIRLKPEENTVIYAAFFGKTLQKVKRAAPAGEGFTFDHFSDKALNSYLTRFDKAFGDKSFGVRCFFNDSYELFNANSSTKIFEEFLKRRGYDLRHYLRELDGSGDEEIQKRVKYDYNLTLSEMLLANFTMNWTQWAHNKNVKTKNQAHGSPANLLDLYGTVDIPEIELSGSTKYQIPGLRLGDEGSNFAVPEPLLLKFASSAGHVNGKQLVSCETFTWLTDHFKTSWSFCKPGAEMAFLAGINHIFYHGTTYSPKEALWPGWIFYAAVEFNPVNSMWPHLTGLNNYITRCQSVLQSAKPDNEILVYWPLPDMIQDVNKLGYQLTVHNINEWLNIPEIRDLLQKGYAFDFISDRQLMNTRIKEGFFSTSEKALPFKALLIPQCTYMPLETFKIINRLAEEGGKVIFKQLPLEVTGLLNYEEKRNELRTLAENLNFTDKEGIKAYTSGKGEIILSQSFENGLKYAGIRNEVIGNSELKFLRLKKGEETYYYLVNHSNKVIDENIPFNTVTKNVIIMDPQTGDWGSAKIATKGNASEVRISLQPGEAWFLKFTNIPVTNVPEWKYFRKTKPFVIEGKWTLQFKEGGPVIPSVKTMAKPLPWTSLNDEDANNFSGSAVYSSSFTFKKQKEADYILTIDEVYENARIFINGQDAGLIWSIPAQVNVGKYLKDGKNTIDIEVTNLMANRIRYMDKAGIEWRKFHEINFVNINYKPFDASDWPVMTSGINGKVSIFQSEGKE